MVTLEEFDAIADNTNINPDGMVPFGAAVVPPTQTTIQQPKLTHPTGRPTPTPQQELPLQQHHQ